MQVGGVLGSGYAAITAISFRFEPGFVIADAAFYGGAGRHQRGAVLAGRWQGAERTEEKLGIKPGAHDDPITYHRLTK
jgi:hypothetical protein